MGFIDNDKLLQDIIDSLNVKVLPGEKQLPYPLPIFQGVSQVINLNDFLKTRKTILSKQHSFTVDLAAGDSEAFGFNDLFTAAETKNRVYRLMNMAFNIGLPPSGTTGNHNMYLWYPAGTGYNAPHIFTASSPYTGNLTVSGNTLNSSTTVLPNDYLTNILRPPVFTSEVFFECWYMNNTDVVQTLPRNFFFIFEEEVVKGL